VFLFFPIPVTSPPISSSSSWLFWLVLAKSTNHEAPRYTVFSTLSSPHLSLVQIFSAPSVYVPPLMLETTFHTIQNHRPNYSLVYFNF
jgi:hypothetical protein